MEKQKFGFTDNNGYFQKIGIRLDESSYVIVSTCSAIFFGIAGVLLGGYSWEKEWAVASGFSSYIFLVISCPYFYFLCATICIIFGAKGTVKDQKAQRDKIKLLERNNRSVEAAEVELSEIKAKIQKLNIDSIVLWLKVYSKQQKLTSKDRVSIYYEDKGDLYILARYSKNPKLTKIHKQKFPLDKGVISKAWEEGFYEYTLPEYKKNQTEYIRKCCEEFGYTECEITELTMKSNSYYAKAIIDADDHIGIIIFESYRNNIIDNSDKEAVSEFLESSSSLLANLIRNARKFERQPVDNPTDSATMLDEQELLKQAKKEAENE